jgi:transmembrane 9 superfamily member 2/4
VRAAAQGLAACPIAVPGSVPRTPRVSCSRKGVACARAPCGARVAQAASGVCVQKSPIKWASRWDTYLLMHDEPIHWFSIVNSLMIVLFLTGMVAMIMLRTLRRDIAKYNQLETAEEAQEETGWKLVHGDAFRPPPHCSLLATCVGTGIQLLSSSVVTMVFAVLGFLSPANRGGLMTAMLFLFVFMGIFGGYAAGRLYKQFKGDAWRTMTLRTALLFPGTTAAVFFALNMLVWGQASSGAVPFSTMFQLCLLWFGVSVPLIFTGSYFGFKKEALEEPVRTNKIPRQVRRRRIRASVPLGRGGTSPRAC